MKKPKNKKQKFPLFHRELTNQKASKDSQEKQRFAKTHEKQEFRLTIALAASFWKNKSSHWNKIFSK